MAQARRVVPGMKKQWRRSGKIHSRIEHDAADGQIRDVDEAFDVGGVELMFPRDPDAPAKDTINCGCQSLPYMESWEQAGALRDPGRRPFTEEEIEVRPEREVLTPTTEPGFARFLRGEGGAASRAIAEAPRRVTDALGSSARRVLISPETAGKQVKHGLAPADYARLPEILRRGEIRQSKARHLDFILEGERSWHAVVKKAAAADGADELYLVSLRRSHPRDTRRLRERGQAVREQIGGASDGPVVVRGPIRNPDSR